MGFAAIFSSFQQRPGYTAMRGIARFPTVRNVVTSFRSALTQQTHRSYVQKREDAMEQSIFKNVDRKKFLIELEQDGLAFGLMLPPQVVSEIREFADNEPVYADRKPDKGFLYRDREAAETKLGKPILVAQYFNTRSCPAVERLVTDPFIEWVAANYLKSVPTFVGCNLWWTSPVDASEEDRNKHAHFFHRDVDDYKFFKFFFYITDVKDDEGAHVCVRRSIFNLPVFKKSDRWRTRRYTDEEISSYYPAADILEITGKAGTGFAEDTLCIHKGSTPKTEPRLLLQIQFAHFDYGVAHDQRDPNSLSMIK